MNLVNYLLSLREELYRKVVKVDNFNNRNIIFRDDVLNHNTKRKLENIHRKYFAKASNFGVFKVTRHISCPNENHVPYVVSNKYGLDIKDQEEKYVWGRFHQNGKKKNCICPCCPDNKSTEHDTLEETIYLKSNEELCV